MQRSGQKKRPRWRNAALKGDVMGSIHVPHACLCREKAELFSQPGERFDSGGKGQAFATRAGCTDSRARSRASTTGGTSSRCSTIPGQAFTKSAVINACHV